LRGGCSTGSCWGCSRSWPGPPFDLLGRRAEGGVGRWNGILGALPRIGAACGGLVFGWLAPETKGKPLPE